ncbi:hypothetical protein HMPREF3223_00608 [Cutibacterium avidum]|nr:hypothetical protein HMPREF3223_00608 [Cutibacterium avidum]OIJ77453.1 hypothetical protein APY07_09030 [Cutibacterium avidum]OIJ77738.1 hypothetical protein APY08_09025 [Cutibacterium avidum]PGX61043.1 hypothetical protein B6N40_10965 [Cutibacterium avidum]PGX66039.1 hypothetical protein B6N41_03280 [Cutibacterium avidum]
MGKQRLRLIFKMALHRPGRAMSAVVLALVLVAACASVSVFVSAYGEAVKRGAQSGFGAFSSQVTGNEDVATYMQSLQSKGEAVAITHSRQNLLAADSDRATSADVTMTSGPADLGVLVSGRYPKKPGELTVSTAVAKQLQARPDVHLELVDADNTRAKASFTVVGITENPASINEITATAISDDKAVFSASEVWLTNDDMSAINNVLDHGGGSVATVASVVDRASDKAASYQAISPQVAQLCGVVMVAAFVAAIYAADRQRRRAVYRVMTALGDKPIRAALTSCAQATLLALCGGMIGWGLAAVSIRGLSARLGSYVEQRWTVAWTAVNSAALATLAMILVGGILAVTLIVISDKRRARAHSEGFSRRALMRIGVVGAIATVLLIMSGQVNLFPKGERAAMVVGALTIPALAYAVTPGTRKHRVVARLGNRLQKLSLGALAVVFALNYWGAFYASGVADLTNWLGGQINGEDSFLEVNDANEQAISNLLQRFPKLKPRTAVFGDISTSEQMFRITDGAGEQCYKTAKTVDQCPHANLDVVYTASGGLRDQDYINHAPASYVTKDGKVTLIHIGIADSAIKSVDEVNGVVGDSNLENNVLSGLILPTDSPLLKQLGVSKPQSYNALIFGFSDLPEEVRDGVRSTILTEAPFANIDDPDDPEARQLRAQAWTRQLFAVIVSGTLLLALVSTLVSDQRIERRLVALTGGRKAVQVRLVEPLLWAYTVTVGSAVILGCLAAMDHIPFLRFGSTVVHDYGLVWTLGLAGLFFLIPAVIVATRSTPGNDNRT